MNRKTVFHLFSPEGKAHLPVAPLVIGLVVLSLLALTACGALPASAPAAVTENEGGQPVTVDIEAVRAQNYTAFREKNAAGAALATDSELSHVRNPEFIEIMRLRRQAAAAGVSSGSAYLAENPELMVAQRYTAALEAGAQRGIEAESARYNGLAEFYAAQAGDQRGIEAESARHNSLAEFYAAQAGETGSAYLADNPELLKARPPVWSLSVICARNLAANPELLKARPPAVAEEMTGSAFLAANPELLKVRPPVWSLSDICARSLAANPTLLEARPPALAEEMTGSAYLAENPELMVARRYEALAKWKRLHHRGR